MGRSIRLSKEQKANSKDISLSQADPDSSLFENPIYLQSRTAEFAGKDCSGTIMSLEMSSKEHNVAFQDKWPSQNPWVSC